MTKYVSTNLLFIQTVLLMNPHLKLHQCHFWAPSCVINCCYQLLWFFYIK